MPKIVTKQFVVGSRAKGDDFDTAEIELLIYKIGSWFSKPECDRTYTDPMTAARQKIQECLLATTEAGDPWRNCPKLFAARVRSKCNWDMDKDEGIPAPRVKRTEGRELDPKAKAGAKSLDAFTPANVDFDQEEYRATLEKNILANAPELDNPIHLPVLRRLSGLYAEGEKIDRALIAGVSDGKREMLLEQLKLIEQMADIQLKRLGVHPDQLRKKVDTRTASSIADLVSQLNEDSYFAEREQVWALQLALQLWWMSEHPNGRKSGRQLSDFEIWHMTRSRPIKFQCRHGEEYTIVEGFEPKELHALLLQRGVLVEEPVIPALTPAAELHGLNDYFTQDGSNGSGTDETEPGGSATDPTASPPPTSGTE